MLAFTLSLVLVFFASTSCEKILENPGIVRIPLEKDLNRTRHIRDVNFPQLKKPSHHDVVIPNWNPNARIKPWQTIGVKSRNRRTLGEHNISPVTDRHPRSVQQFVSQQVASQETVYRSPRSVEQLHSQQLDSQETVFRSARSVQQSASQQVRSSERVFRSPRSVEQLASQQVASQESVI